MNMPKDKTPQEKQLSSCCKAEIAIHSGEEGTNYYVCSACNLPVNPDGTNPHKLLKPAPQEKEIWDKLPSMRISQVIMYMKKWGYYGYWRDSIKKEVAQEILDQYKIIRTDEAFITYLNSIK